ncbi:hypothetical protein RJT34_24293 [Clitoria ternatea]|uniref:Uncharacterized protein n=1 Tax=Clitoria ternatea TaxID=43366 RepID=A0AAN9FQE7_CLITE
MLYVPWMKGFFSLGVFYGVLYILAVGNGGTKPNISTIGAEQFDNFVGRSYISSFLLSRVSNITEKHGHKGWILNNLNAPHLDYYYAFLAILNFLNFILFLVAAKYFVYRAEISDAINVFAEELSEKRANVPNQANLSD